MLFFQKKKNDKKRKAFNEFVCLCPPFTLLEISSPCMREEFAASIGFLLESDHENKII